MNHTPESLLALKESPEGLEQLRIIAAQFDGWINVGWQPRNCFDKSTDIQLGNDKDWWRHPEEKEVCMERDLPLYPTSLDAIFAAEERLGLHDESNMELRAIWESFADAVILHCTQNAFKPESHELAFLPPPLRLIPFILAAQWKEQNQ